MKKFMKLFILITLYVVGSVGFATTYGDTFHQGSHFKGVFDCIMAGLLIWEVYEG